MTTRVAVLTGDLIDSRNAPDGAVDRAMQTLAEAAAAFGRDMAPRDLRFTRFRGDGWQALLADPALILDAVLWMLARLRAADSGVDTRISVGVAEITSPGTRDLSDAAGPAFHIAGENLDGIGRRRRLAIAGPPVTPCLAALLDLVDFVTSGWTPAQAEAVHMALSPRYETQEDIAAALGVTRQAVQLRLAAAGYAYLEAAFAAVRAQDFQGEAR